MRIAQEPKVELRVVIRLDEEEIRALDALVGYGVDPFLDMFYKNLGQSYMKPHEAGLRTLFETVRKEVPPMLNRADKARKAFYNQESQ